MRKNNVNTKTNNGGIDMMRKINVRDGLMKTATVLAIGVGLKAGSWIFDKIKDTVSDFVESQKLSPEEVEKMGTVIEIRRGKNYKPDENDQFEEDEATEEDASTNPVVTGEDVTSVAAEIVKETTEEESSDASETTEEESSDASETKEEESSDASETKEEEKEEA